MESMDWQLFCLDTEADDLETDYFYFINAIRAREKKGVAVTDVTAFDQLDGVVVNQDTSKLQQGYLIDVPAVFHVVVDIISGLLPLLVLLLVV